jgi:hypothetical protein
MKRFRLLLLLLFGTLFHLNGQTENTLGLTVMPLASYPAGNSRSLYTMAAGGELALHYSSQLVPFLP